MSHTHLTSEERDSIAELRSKGYSFRKIGRTLHRDHTSILREIRRNSTPLAYHPCAAQKKASTRKRGRPPRKMEDPQLATFVKEKLRLDFSPETISGRGAILDDALTIGRQTIYTWIKTELAKGRKWHRYLPRQGKPYRKAKSGVKLCRRGKSIAERPESVLSRDEIGHWEGDTLEGRKGGDAVICLVERKSRYTVLCRVENRSAAALEEAVRKRFSWKRGFLRETLTVDRGGEFGDGVGLEKAFGSAVYFTDAYSPWQKGTVEQTNGLLRRYLPKGFDGVRGDALQFVEERLNNRPRKCLGYVTPHEVLFAVSPTP